MLETVLAVIGIAFCLTQSAMFSGLNLAYFSISRMRLEAEMENGNPQAETLLRLREDPNFLLCTILWGNVSVNVLLALLSESVFAGLGGFVFSTAGITFFGEIIPQAYFARHAIRVGARLAPVIRGYQVLLWVVAKPCALLLDGWIGAEGPNYLREQEIETILQKHISEQDSEIGETEGRGALNFLELDDLRVSREGRPVEPDTVFSFPTHLDLPVLPQMDTPDGAAFIGKLKATDRSWAVITDLAGTPRIVINTPGLLLAVLRGDRVDPYEHAHRPIVVTDPEATLDASLGQFVVEADHRNDYLIDKDVILFWSDDSRRIITGADILGRLLRGIARREAEPAR